MGIHWGQFFWIQLLWLVRFSPLLKFSNELFDILLISFPFLETNFWYLLSLNLDRHLCMNTQLLSRVWLFVIPWTVSLPGSSVHEILQASILEWVAISSSRGSPQSRDHTHMSCISCVAGGFFTTAPPGKPQTLIYMVLTTKPEPWDVCSLVMFELQMT